MKEIHHCFVTLLLLSIVLISCSEDDKDPISDNIMVQFSSEGKTFAENEGSQSITISLSKPAQTLGTITVTLNGGIAEGYTTVPASANESITLPVAKGVNTVSLQLIPLDNESVNELSTIIIKIENVSLGFVIGTQSEFKATITDDESPEPAEFSEANFSSQHTMLNETNETGLELQIHFSKPITQEGYVLISYQSVKATEQNFRTEPALVNGKITLNPALNSQVATFKVIPINNETITGELDVTFWIENTGGSIIMGTSLTELVEISDDELVGKVKGFQSLGGNWGLSETIEYNEWGGVQKVLIEMATPATNIHTETYYYDEQQQIQRINKHENVDVYFHWENNEITESEEIKSGIVTTYTLYDYDDFGNVSGSASYFRKDNGEYSLDLKIVYVYFQDGNLHKKLVYTLEEGEKETLVQTETFEHYTDSENPFPIVRILPNKNTQKKLPLSYRLEKGETDLSYTLSYEFRADGLLSKRTVSGGDATETTAYFYY